MRNRFVEIEMARNSVRLALWERGHLIREYWEPLPDNYATGGEIVSMAALGRFLKDAAERHGMKSRHCRLLLPEHLTYVRMVKLPAMSREQIRLNLPYEFRDFIHDHMEQYRFEYVVTETVRDSSGKVSEMWVMALAVSESLVEEYRYMLRGTGWKVDAISTVPFVYADRIRDVEKLASSSGGEYCLVVPGYENIRVYFYKGRNLTAYWEIEARMTQLSTEAEHERLCGKICQTLEFYEHRYPESRLDMLDISGEEAEWLGGILEEMSGIPCERASQLFDVLPAGKNSLNLVKRYRFCQSVGRFVLMVLGFILFLGCFGWFAVHLPLSEMRHSRAELSRLAVDLSTYRAANMDYEAVEEDYQTYFASYLTDEEALLTGRYEVLNLIWKHAKAHGEIQHISVEGQECSLLVGELTLWEVSELAEKLELEKAVRYVEISDVLTDKMRTDGEKQEAVIEDKLVTAKLLIGLNGGAEDAS